MTPSDDGQFLHRLEIEVQLELEIARSSHLDASIEGSPADWLFDPTDVEREQVGLGSLLGAVEALAADFDVDLRRDVEASTQDGDAPSTSP